MNKKLSIILILIFICSLSGFNWKPKTGLYPGLSTYLGGGLAFVLSDQFDDTDDSPIANPRICVPGPRSFTVVDTGSLFSIGSGILSTSASITGALDPSIVCSTGISRTPGRMLIVKHKTNSAAGVTSGPFIGWHKQAIPTLWTNNDIGLIQYGLSNRIEIGSTDYIISTASTDTWYTHKILLRTIGAFVLDSNNYIRYVDDTSNTAILYPIVCGLAAGRYRFAIDFIKIPYLLFLPRTIFAHTFNDVVTPSDGGGLTGIESGGSGTVLTTISGTPAISGNLLTFTSSGVLTYPTSTDNLYIKLKIKTPAAGVTPGGILIRYTDADNYWYLKITPGTAGTDFELIQRQGGVENTRASKDVDWVANTVYTIDICIMGNIYFIINSKTTTAYMTYTDAGNFGVGVKTFGFKDEGDSNFSFGTIIAWPSGYDGNYTFLNAIANN